MHVCRVSPRMGRHPFCLQRQMRCENATADSLVCECGLSAPRLRTRRTHDLSNGMSTDGRRLPTATERRVLTHYYIYMGLGQCVKNYRK